MVMMNQPWKFSTLWKPKEMKETSWTTQPKKLASDNYGPLGETRDGSAITYESQRSMTITVALETGPLSSCDSRFFRSDGNGMIRLGWQTGPRSVNFQNCYLKGHYTPDFSLNFRESPSVFLNGKKFNVGGKARVP